MSNEADKIPPYSSSGSMNVHGDIAQLSYKELQALALRYRVPGNIKKKVLVKVLQAARSGNETEFSRLLQELRKNRKRKTKKSKDSKLGMTSTPLHSPDYIMTDDDYYCQQQQPQLQQQPPYQWIGAEEEIVSKDNDARFPQYEEFKQFLLKRFQREFQSCDSNNNQMQDLGIMDLRTTPMPANLQATMPFNEPSYPRANAIDDADPLAIPPTDRSSYHMSEGSSQGSFLLKRMLQAPVGANLGEIASSLLWASNLLDNSDTLTAESDSNVNEDRELDEELALEEQLTEANANEYYLVNNTKDEYLMSETNLMSQQIPNVLANDNQYRFSTGVNNRPNSYQNWTVTNVMEMPNSDAQTSRMFHTIYHNNTEPVATATNGNLSYQYQTDTVYNDSQNFFNYGTHDTSYMTGADMTATNDSSDMYYLQNYGKHNGEIGAGYYCNVDAYGQNNAQQDAYANDSQYQYLYPRFTQETNNPLGDQLNYSLNDPFNERLEQQQSNVTGIENVSQEANAGDLYRQANETMEPFWPKWTTQASNNLENILNFQSVRQHPDCYSKLSQTSCVYCYMAPIVTQRSNLAKGCSMKQRYIAEQRQHSFSSYWMLYNDTSQGTRITNTSGYLLEQPATTMARATTFISKNDLKETNDNPQIPINDVWMNQYEPASGDDVNASDSLFCNVTATRINNIPNTPDIAKT